ncbi:MAG: hypothetical protein GON13_01345 [Nanoarchaeota archaeon]|nr:hypothetical protein [Nanoarchaeota archaeon]
MRKTVFLAMLFMISAVNAVEFTITNSTGGTQFILGDYFTITPETNFLGSAEIEIITTDDDWHYVKQLFFEKNNSYIFKSTVSDQSGNWIINFKTQNITTQKNITAILTSENAYFGVNFNSPVQTLTYTRGETITISVEVFRSVEKIAGAKVTALIDEEELNLIEVNNGVYTVNYDLKYDSQDNYKLIRITAEKNLAQGIRKGGAFLKLNVNPAKINVTIIEPEKNVFKPGATILFKIKSHYPDKTLALNVNVTINTPEGKLAMNTVNDYFNISYKIPNNFLGTWNAHFTVVDEYGNKGEIQKNILILTQSIITHPLVILATIVFIIISVFFFFFGGTKFLRITLLKHYTAKQKDLKRMQDITQKKYFDRVIDEETYMELMRKHEAKLVSVQTSVKELKKKLGIKKNKGGKKGGKKK